VRKGNPLTDSEETAEQVADQDDPTIQRIDDSPPHGGILFVLSSPTGGGKTTIARRLVAEDGALRFSVSHTTRRIRPGEQEGVDYHFVAPAEFARMAGRGEFLEWAEVHGHRYGTHRREREIAGAEGKDLLLDIDVQGGLQVRGADPEAVLVFILPPSLEVLLARLGKRAVEPGFDLARRLTTAERELELAKLYDYTIINEDLDKAVGQVRRVLESSRLRSALAAGRVRILLAQVSDWLRSSDVSGEREDR
jgi:guanylate kinase